MITNFVMYSYVLLGLFLIFFNKFIGAWVYKFTLLFTDKLKLSDLFIFRIDSKNKDSFFFLTRSFSIMFGICIIAASFYIL